MSRMEVAATLSLSRSAVYRLIEDGELRAYKVRGRLRIEPGELVALKQRNRVSPRRRGGPPIYEPLPLTALGGEGRFATELKAMKEAT